MTIIIEANEKNEVTYSINGEESCIFSYENLYGFIDRLANAPDEKVDVSLSDELNEQNREKAQQYKKLVEEIVKETRTADFIDAVRKARDAKENLEKEEASNPIAKESQSSQS